MTLKLTPVTTTDPVYTIKKVDPINISGKPVYVVFRNDIRMDSFIYKGNALNAIAKMKAKDNGK